jgi:hypothetical protein
MGKKKVFKNQQKQLCTRCTVLNSQQKPLIEKYSTNYEDSFDPYDKQRYYSKGTPYLKPAGINNDKFWAQQTLVRFSRNVTTFCKTI